MKQIKKRWLSALLVISLIMSCSVSAFASGNDSVNRNRYNEMIAEGLNDTEARQLLKVERITAKLEAKELRLEYVGDEMVLVNSKNHEVTAEENNIDSKDIEYMVTIYEQVAIENVTYETMVADANELMEANPGRTQYRIEYDNGMWVEITTVLERVDTIEDETVSTYFDNATYPNEVEIEKENFLADGDYTYEYECKCFNGVSYSKNYVKQSFTISDDNHHVAITSKQGGAAGYGVVTLVAESLQGVVEESDINENPELWCEVVYQASFESSASVGLTLGEIFEISVNKGQIWTQYAIIRTSLVACHSYAAYYI